jgi:hypothetical protein
MDATCVKDNSLSNGTKDHSQYEHWSSSICVGVWWQNEEADKHAYHIAGTDESNILGRLTEQIKLLNPVIDIFGVCLVKAE